MDSTLKPSELQEVLSSVQHALRGSTGSYLALSLLTNLFFNRRAVLTRHVALRVIVPSRNVLAITVFIGVFRLVERLSIIRGRDERMSTSRASFCAAATALLCVETKSRTPVMALACTHALGKIYDDLIVKYKLPPTVRIVDLLVFVLASAWTIMASLFHPDTFIPSHLRALMRYTLVSPKMASYLQERYRHGINPRSCAVRHEGMNCRQFFVPFTKQMLQTALRVYVPVHLASFLFALRKWRQHPNLGALFGKLVKRIVGSCAYLVTYVVSGWTGVCMTQKFGDKSLLHRRLQYAIWGGLSALSILMEDASRRRPIGVILCSYAFTSMGSLVVKNYLPVLQQRKGNHVRVTIDLLAVGFAMAYTSQHAFDRNLFLRRILYGTFPTVKVLSSSDTQKRDEYSDSDEEPADAIEAAAAVDAMQLGTNEVELAVE